MHQLIDKKQGLFPMPVLLISTYNEDGSVDTMNAAWGTLEDTDVILLELTRDHKTSENILREKCFTVAPATIEHIREADYFGLVSGNEVKDKFAKSGLHSHDAGILHAPVIDEYPLSMVCEVVRVDETNGDFAVYGKIVSLSVDDSIRNENGAIDAKRCRFVSYFPIDHSYRLVEEKVADAFRVGKTLK